MDLAALLLARFERLCGFDGAFLAVSSIILGEAARFLPTGMPSPPTSSARSRICSPREPLDIWKRSRMSESRSVDFRSDTVCRHAG